MGKTWTVRRHRRADRQAKKWKKVNKPMLTKVLKFEAELRAYGVPQSQEFTKNMQKTRGTDDCFHCHLKGGQPTMVAVWIICKDDRNIEVSYYGTHEGVGDYVHYCK